MNKIWKGYTVREVSEITGVSRQLVRKLIRDGSIPAVQLGGRRYTIFEDDLEKFIDARRVKRNVAPGKNEAGK